MTGSRRGQRGSPASPTGRCKGACSVCDVDFWEKKKGYLGPVRSRRILSVKHWRLVILAWRPGTARGTGVMTPGGDGTYLSRGNEWLGLTAVLSA